MEHRDNELAERVLNTITKALRLPPEEVTLDSTFEDLGIDSLDVISLVFELEQEFNIEIPDEEARSIRGVRQVVDGVSRLVATSNSASQAS